MRNFLIVMSVLLAGCDSIQGITMPVHPHYDGDWTCVTEELEQDGYRTSLDTSNQLSVMKGDQYLFSVYPNNYGDMKIYLYTMNTPLSCSVADRSYREMLRFLDVMENSCGYTAQSYSVSFECRSKE